MRTCRRWASCLSLLLFNAAAWADTPADPVFATIAAPSFGYCQARHPESCSNHEFEASCSTICSGQCEEVSSSVSQFQPWELHGGVLWLPSPGGDLIFIGLYLGAEGQRVADSFVVSGSYTLTSGGSLELAVLRYAGDPQALDGEEFSTVYDLVVLGLIEPADILLVKTDFDTTGASNSEPYSVEVDVTGLADEEIAIFVSGASAPSPTCVPATGPASAAVLAIALVVASYRRARRAV